MLALLAGFRGASAVVRAALVGHLLGLEDKRFLMSGKRRIAVILPKADLGAATRGRFLCNKMQRILDSGPVPSNQTKTNLLLLFRSVRRLVQGDGSSVRKTVVFHTDEPSPRIRRKLTYYYCSEVSVAWFRGTVPQYEKLLFFIQTNRPVESAENLLVTIVPKYP